MIPIVVVPFLGIPFTAVIKICPHILGECTSSEIVCDSRKIITANLNTVLIIQATVASHVWKCYSLEL